MANMELDGLPAPGRLQRIVYGGGALLSLGLVLGFCIWGYKLAMRDMAGIPVVRAMEGPMRVAPAEPGGTISEHQGLSVNAVAADGATGDPADRLVLAPPPVDLTLEDSAGGFSLVAAPVSGRASDSPGTTLVAAEPEPAAEVLAAADDGTATFQLDPTADVVPLAGSLDGATDAAPARTMPGVMLAGVIRPMPRPAEFGGPPDPVFPAVAASAPADGAGGAVVPATETDPATLTPGTRLAQLGAFDSVETARVEWDRVAMRFGDLMSEKSRVIEPKQSGGRAFYRLRVLGFDSDAAARRFCASLLSEQVQCIPVIQK